MGGKQILLTRQDSLLSSSSRRKARPDDRAHAPACSVGCVSNILHLFSKYHTRRKFLTSGKKQEKPVIICSKEEGEHNNNNKLVQTSKKQANSSVSVEQEEHDHRNYGEKKTNYSPSSESATPSTTRPAVVVARLMGLDGFPAVPASSESASAEKRKELLRGLEKCDQDLRSLRKIIDALRSDTAKHDDQDDDERRPSQYYYSTSFSSPQAPGGLILMSNKEARQLDCREQPSPDSVLHQFTPPSPPPHAAVACFANNVNQRSNGTTIQRQPRKKPREEGYRVNFSSINKSRKENVASSSSYRHSKAMGESVEELCHNVAWGEKSEAKRIGLALKEGIWKDLIEEIVKEMGCLSRLILYLPSARCRRRLSL